MKIILVLLEDIFLKRNDVIKIRKGRKRMMKRKYWAIGIILLFVGTTITPSPAQQTEKSSLPSSRGDILNVGGVGPGNYTKIQDAINDSDSGDTVFVYDDSSPYYGVLVVDRSINLVGENNISTVIDGHSSQDVITVFSDGVTISSFTIQNSASIDVPNINIKANFVSIINNVIRHGVREGIRLWGVKNILIEHNTFKDCVFPIYLSDAHDVKILSNVIHTFSNAGVLTDDGVTNLTIFGNTFYNTNGLAFDVNIGNVEGILIKRNSFNSLHGGLYVTGCKDCLISENNFMSDKLWVTFLFFYPPSPRKNHVSFDNNYWNKSRSLPKPIIGYILPYNGLLFFLFYGLGLLPPFIQFDWHPAKEPFDISG